MQEKKLVNINDGNNRTSGFFLLIRENFFVVLLQDPGKLVCDVSSSMAVESLNKKSGITWLIAIILFSVYAGPTIIGRRTFAR